MIEKLTLRQARDERRLDEFIDQAEANGVGPVCVDDFDRVAAAAIRTPPQPDQTSGSPRRDGSRGK